jgi:hypothetical protein
MGTDAADFNNDGILDIAAVNFDSNNMSIIFGNGIQNGNIEIEPDYQDVVFTFGGSTNTTVNFTESILKHNISGSITQNSQPENLVSVDLITTFENLNVLYK